MKYNGMVNRAEILEYAEYWGYEAAANLLLLGGPDGYADGYEDYKDLEALLNNGQREEAKA